MIICHCQNISCQDIDSAIEWMRASDPMTIITPGKVYRALGKDADCGGCMPLFLDTMRRNDKFEVPNLRVPATPGQPAIHDQGPQPCKATQKSSNT